jgi:hypothetical protein
MAETQGQAPQNGGSQESETMKRLRKKVREANAQTQTNRRLRGGRGAPRARRA